jgi:Ricin-type beta-trefoil lectin domain
MKRFGALEKPILPAWARFTQRKAVLLAAALGTAIVSTVVGVAPAQAVPTQTVTIRNWNNGYCLDSDNIGSPFGALIGYVYQDSCTGASSQGWLVISNPGSGQSWLQNQATGLCLTASGAGGFLEAESCNGGTAQDWQISAFTDSLGHLVWSLYSDSDSGCLDSQSESIIGQAYPFVNSSCFTGGTQDWAPGPTATNTVPLEQGIRSEGNILG